MLKTRLKTSVPLIAVALSGFLWPGLPGAVIFYLFAAVLVVSAVREYTQMAETMGYAVFTRVTIIFAFALLTLTCFSARPVIGLFGVAQGVANEVVLLVAFLVSAWVCALRPFEGKQSVQRYLLTVGGFFAFVWPLNFIPKLYFCAGLGSTGRWLTLFLIIVTKMGDVGAYAAGSLTASRVGGNRKLAPTLSPKKSWEGLFGGIAACVLSACLFVGFGGRCLEADGIRLLGLGGAVCFGVLAAVLGLVGDLSESALKRAAGVKDSGRLPGLGGVLDMMDSLLFVGPLFYGYIIFRLTT